MSKHSIRDLVQLIGTWDCTEIFHAGGWTPEEIHTANARDRFSWGPGKKYILADYESISSFGLFEAHDVIFWDEAKQKFAFYFFDSFGGAVEIQDGVLAGDTLTFTSRAKFGERGGTTRRLYRFVSETQQSLEVSFVPDEGDPIRIATIDKTKRA